MAEMSRIDEIKARLDAANWKKNDDGTLSIDSKALANFRGMAEDDMRYLLAEYEKLSSAILEWYTSEHVHDIVIHVPGYECPACNAEAKLMGIARPIQVQSWRA
jgi:hypothetical protein